MGVDVPRPRLLDLFAGAGGAAVGYSRAGFDVVGVDIAPQPNYPFPFHQADALDVLRRLIAGKAVCFNPLDDDLKYLTLAAFAAIHVSPPCQAHCTLTKGHLAQGHDNGWTDVLTPTRPLLVATGLPHVIENVPGAPMRADLTLCGLMFGLAVFRHRLFELERWELTARPEHPTHRGHRVAGWRHGMKHEGDMTAVYGNGGGKGDIPTWQAAMGIDWTDVRHEIAEAIPPAYTEFIGAQLLKAIT